MKLEGHLRKEEISLLELIQRHLIYITVQVVHFTTWEAPFTQITMYSMKPKQLYMVSFILIFFVYTLIYLQTHLQTHQVSKELSLFSNFSFSFIRNIIYTKVFNRGFLKFSGCIPLKVAKSCCSLNAQYAQQIRALLDQRSSTQHKAF